MYLMFDFETPPKQFLSSAGTSLLIYLFVYLSLLIYWFLLKLFFFLKHFKLVCWIDVLVLLTEKHYSFIWVPQVLRILRKSKTLIHSKCIRHSSSASWLCLLQFVFIYLFIFWCASTFFWHNICTRFVHCLAWLLILLSQEMWPEAPLQPSGSGVIRQHHAD